MPYIEELDALRMQLSAGAEEGMTIRNPGELNAVISACAAQYIKRNGLSYQTINDVSGALTEALAEFRRAIVVPYEDTKLYDRSVARFDPYRGLRAGATETQDDWAARLRKDS